MITLIIVGMIIYDDEVIYYNYFIFNYGDCVGHGFDDDYINHDIDIGDDSYRVKSSLTIYHYFSWW